MNNRHLIAVDLDNTILSHYFSLDPDSVTALIEAQNAGHITMIATARPHAMAVPYHRAMGFHGPICTLNGAYAYHPDDEAFPVREALVNTDAVAAFDSIARETGVRKVWMELNHHAHAVSAPSPGFFYYHEVFRQSGVTWHDELPAIPAGRIYACADTQEQADAIMQTMTARPDVSMRCYFHPRTGEYRINCCSAHADKWYAVKHAADFYSIPTENIITFGDEANDRLMLLSAGHGFALLNGSESLKSEIPAITALPCGQGGVGGELRRILL